MLSLSNILIKFLLSYICHPTDGPRKVANWFPPGFKLYVIWITIKFEASCINANYFIFDVDLVGILPMSSLLRRDQRRWNGLSTNGWHMKTRWWFITLKEISHKYNQHHQRKSFINIIEEVEEKKWREFPKKHSIYI